MSVDFTITLPEKGARLLRVIVGEIKSGRIQKGHPETFLSYSEALQKLGIEARGRAGQQLQREGLNELNNWTQIQPDVPKVAGLIVTKRWHAPSEGFARSHGWEKSDWHEWWLAETSRAIDFDWSVLIEGIRNKVRVQETGETMEPKAIERITFDPARMGGKPCIRGMRVTVGTIVGLVAAGRSHRNILELYPYLEPQDIQAALRFAAWRSEEQDLPMTHA